MLCIQSKEFEMNRDDFVQRIRMCVYDTAVSEVRSLLRVVPGRAPRRSSVARSRWYNQLCQQDRAMIDEVVSDAARSATAGMLEVIDGVRPILDGDKPYGEIELRYRNDAGAEDVLTCGDGSLSAVFLAIVPFKI